MAILGDTPSKKKRKMGPSGGEVSSARAVADMLADEQILSTSSPLCSQLSLGAQLCHRGVSHAFDQFQL